MASFQPGMHGAIALRVSYVNLGAVPSMEMRGYVRVLIPGLEEAMERSQGMHV